MKETKLVPTEKTKKIIDRFQFIEYQNDGLYSLRYLTNNNSNQFLKNIGNFMEGQALVFNMHCTNPYFAMYTNLPLNNNRQLQFSSLHTKKQIDLSNRVLKSAFSESENAAEGIIGSISIYPQSIINNNCELNNNKFSICLKARELYWNYYVFNRNNYDLNQAIVTNNQGIMFKNMGETKLTNGEKAFLFSSDKQMFSLKEDYQFKLDLIGSKYPNLKSKWLKKTILINGLPTPSINNINIQTKNNIKYAYSNIYVYV